MATYRLVPSTDSVYFIHLSRQRIGQVVKRAGNREWVARIDNITAYGNTARIAFDEVCRAKNRVNICGENDVEKARAKIEEQSAATVKHVRSLNQLLGIPLFKTRRRRVHI